MPWSSTLTARRARTSRQHRVDNRLLILEAGRRADSRFRPAAISPRTELAEALAGRRRIVASACAVAAPLAASFRSRPGPLRCVAWSKRRRQRPRRDVGRVVTVEGPADGAVRAITRAITPGQSGVITVTRGRSMEGNAARRRDKTAGQRVSDLRWEWWPGAGSNRRPSDFQSDARTN